MADENKKKDEHKRDESERNEGEKGGQAEYKREEDRSDMNQDMNDYSDIDEV